MRLSLGLVALALPAVAAAQPSVTPASPAASSPASPAAPAADQVAVAEDAPRVATAPGAAVPVASVPALSVAPPGTAPLLERDAGSAAGSPPALTGLARRVAGDAASHRAYFGDTALIAPRGKVTVQFRAPAVPLMDTEIQVSLHDRFEIGASGLVVADEDGAVVGAHARGQIWRNERAAVALGLRYYGFSDASGENVTIGSAVASTCLDGPDCVALVSFSLDAFVIASEDVVPVFAGVSWALGRSVQFVGEIHVSNDDSESLTAGFLGMRAAARTIAFDAGIAFASLDADCFDCSGSDTESFPFFGLSIRP